MRARTRGIVAAGALVAVAACTGPRHPRTVAVAPVTFEIGRPGAALRGVAGDGRHVYAAVAGGGKTTVSVVESADGRFGPGRGTTPAWHATGAWHAELPGSGGPLARTGSLVVATSAAKMRGDPGSLVIGLDAATGAERWRVTLDATRWAVIAAIAPTPDGGVVVGGSFMGTLRAAARVVASAGREDGFVARITAGGELAWLVRLGGPGADAVESVAVRGDRIAIAGTFAAGADLLGQRLPPFDERSPLADAFVAELDGGGARRWAATFGGKANDAVAGVAIDSRDRVVVAATARGVVHVGSSELVAQGTSDALVAWLTPDGEKGPAILIGGLDFDGARAIAAVGDHVVVGGFYSGRMDLGGRTITAGGGDDAFVAVLDGSGAVDTSWQVGGDGREEIVQLAAIPGGFVAGVAHTARAMVGTAPLPSPSDPMSGAAIVVRAAP